MFANFLNQIFVLLRVSVFFCNKPLCVFFFCNFNGYYLTNKYLSFCLLRESKNKTIPLQISMTNLELFPIFMLGFVFFFFAFKPINSLPLNIANFRIITILIITLNIIINSFVLFFFLSLIFVYFIFILLQAGVSAFGSVLMFVFCLPSNCRPRVDFVVAIESSV